jgi:hypothetical protein
MTGPGRQAVVRIGVHPPVPAIGVAEREHIEHELADDLGRIQPGQASGDPVEDDDAADLVGDDHPIRQLVREDQAPDRNRTLGKRADAGSLAVSDLAVRRLAGRLRGR